jgi:hypothetical protein
MSRRLQIINQICSARATWGTFLVALLAAFAVSGTIASGAQAVPNWKINGVFLNAGQKVKVKVKDKDTWTWADGLKVTCNTKSKEELIGIGENQYNSVIYEGCVVNNPANCNVKEVTAENVGAPKWHTKLLEVGGQFFVEIENAEVEVVVEGAGCPGNLIRNIRGNTRYRWVSDGGPIDVEDQELESSEAVTLEGSVTLEPEGEESLAVGKEGGGTCSGGSHFSFCDDNQEPLTGSSVLGTGGLALLAGHIGGAEAKFDCKSSDYQSTLEALGSATGLVRFLSCKLEKPAKCKLSAAQEAEVDAKFTIKQESATLATFTGAGSGEEFVTLTVEKSGSETCAVPGTYPITGKQKVETPKGAVSLANQEMVAKKTGSALKLGTETASFSSTTSNAMLSSGLAWLVMAGE